MSNWKKVISASDCSICNMCGEPICPSCDIHYSDCECPGPTQDLEYKEIDGILMANLDEE